MFWALMIVVSLKYVVLIMRADNRGEGGIMALIALAQSAVREQPQWRLRIALIGMFGAALFYGDAVLTPAISVLSAVEGLEIATSAFKPYVVPIAVGVLLALFAIQKRGTAVGRDASSARSPSLWFIAIGVAGIHGIVQAPAVLAALNPLHALALPHQPRLRLVRRARLGGARGHRRRGALRRHGSLRQEGRSASAGSASWRRRWCSTISGRARCSWCAREAVVEPVLPAAARLGALPDGRARDRGRR